jgi:hypothetical protein
MEHPIFQGFEYILPMATKDDIRSAKNFLDNNLVFSLPYEIDRRRISDDTIEQFVHIFDRKRG